MQRYFAIQKKDKKFILEPSDYHHIKNVMRMNDDDLIEIVFDKKLYIGCIENVKQELTISLQKEIKNEQVSMPEITIIIPVLKENKMDLILQKSTELGINRIIPVWMERTIIKDKKGFGEKKISRWIKICKEASEQSKRTTIPIVENIRNLNEIENLIGLNLVCSTKEDKKNVKKVVKLNRKCDRINVVVGPEGGLSDKEEELLKKKNFIPITLGKRIMRVETVPIFIMSILNYEYME